MRFSPDAMIDRIIDRPLPRALATFVTVGAISFGTYEMMRSLNVSAAEHNAGVQACAGMLGDEAAHVRSAEVPDQCDTFRTSFSYRDTTVRVVAPGSEEDIRTTHQRTYDLPSASGFRSAHLETASDDRKQESVDRKTALVLGGSDFAIFFLTLSVLARSRRGRREGASESAAAESPAA